MDGTISTKSSSTSPSISTHYPSKALSHHHYGAPPVSGAQALQQKSSSPTHNERSFANLAANDANTKLSPAPAPAPTATSRPESAARVTFAEPPDQKVHAVEREVDLLAGNTFFPSIAISEKEILGLSKIGRAEKDLKNLKMWETLLAEHKEKMPSLVPVVEEKLRKRRIKEPV
ncbi:hypothetical protein ONS95_013706 [Cadophora gregata]|uniref:uncharacterized protein n=1 Tax=Cadophora gregata TaxID=51156 RepID=UPI0026DB767F|nr:uncharacterized protein ONS95_013706 [Cadophora gregata]KAK0114206.1 hypothetical protein ONS95_013706 [Cadophora gregata]